MIILRQKEYSWKDALRKGVHSALSIAKEEMDSKYGPSDTKDNDPIFGTLVIDWWVDKSRYIGKDKTYEVHDDMSVEAFDKNSTIGWDLSEEFEPFSVCPGSWKKFTISGTAIDGEYLGATIITRDGKKLIGKVIVEVRK